MLGKIAGNGIVTTRESPSGRVWLAADQWVLAESPSGVRGISLRCAALSDCWNRQAGDSISAHERALGGIAKRGGGFVVPRGGGSAGGITKR